MSHRIKIVKQDINPLLESFVMFPPTTNSKYCTEPNPNTMCQIVDWSIKVGDGSYIVEISVGDSKRRSKVDFKINGEYITENKVIPKGNLQFSKRRWNILITTECENNCSFSMGKLNAVTITPVIEKGSPLDKLRQGSLLSSQSKSNVVEEDQKVRKYNITD